mmetsp:Transcript_15274/g.15410  ORF Transcript_15274/g.15410 Transcript_15274/m.15410 type:complete len:383 (-) Transcript_15274:47-1195(-)
MRCRFIVNVIYLQLTIFCVLRIESRLTSIDYYKLDEIESSPLVNDSAFIKACKEMSGYYLDPPPPSLSPSLSHINTSRVLFMAGMNTGYGDFLLNFQCHTRRLGLKFLTLAFDAAVIPLLRDHQITGYYLMPEGSGSRGKVVTEDTTFFSKNFNVIGGRKLEAVYAALILGYDVVFSDVDIGLFRDPLSFLFPPGVDLVHSSNNRCGLTWRYEHGTEGNSGFYAVRSSTRTISVWNMAYRACAQEKLFNDQTILWHVLRHNPFISTHALDACPQSYVSDHPFDVTTCVLDDCVFSAGGLATGSGKEDHYGHLLGTLKQRGQPPVMAHANYLIGRELKKQAMNRTGLWLLQPNNSRSPMISGGMKHKHRLWKCGEALGALMLY